MKISVVTICYNAVDTLERTMISVLNQTYKNLEYIVIDGGSTDGCLSVIEHYSDRLAYWVSEKDSGIYNAMNKGVQKATGDFCLFMNAGDYMANDCAIEWAVPLLQEAAICVGGAVYTKAGRVENWVYAPQNPTFRHFYTSSICHQSAFIPRMMLLEYPYDESLRMVSDWKYWIEHIVLKGCDYVAIPVTISICNKEGVTYTQLEQGRTERKKVEAQLIPQRILMDYRQRVEEESLIARFIRRSLAYIRRHKNIIIYTCKVSSNNRY